MIEITFPENQLKERAADPDYLSTFKLFWEMGYDSYCADENMKLRLLDKESIRKNAAMAEKHFFSNFVFIHKTSDNARRKLSDL